MAQNSDGDNDLPQKSLYRLAVIAAWHSGTGSRIRLPGFKS